jgi:hypothetical protein
MKRVATLQGLHGTWTTEQSHWTRNANFLHESQNRAFFYFSAPTIANIPTFTLYRHSSFTHLMSPLLRTFPLPGAVSQRLLAT